MRKGDKKERRAREKVKKDLEVAYETAKNLRDSVVKANQPPSMENVAKATNEDVVMVDDGGKDVHISDEVAEFLS
jgi:hypothetical protein